MWQVLASLRVLELFWNVILFVLLRKEMLHCVLHSWGLLNRKPLPLKDLLYNALIIQDLFFGLVKDDLDRELKPFISRPVGEL